MHKLKLSNFLQNSEKILFFLTILFLPTQLGRHFWPSFSSVYSLRIDYLSPTIYFWDLLVLSLVFIYALRLIFKEPEVRLNKTAVIIFSFFLITQSASILFAQNQGASLVRFKEYSVAILFGLFLASSSFASIKKPLLTGLLSAAAFSCFLGIAQFLTGSSLGFWLLGERTFDVTTPLIAKFNFYDKIFLRSYGTFSHPNMLAGFLVVILPLLLAGLEKPLHGIKIMLSLLITSTIFISFSRPGLILAGIYLTVYFKRFWKLLAILVVLTAPLVFVRLTSIFTFDSLAILRRQELSEFAVKLFFLHPILGVGLNNFINTLASTEVLVGTSRFLQPVHDIFLLSLSETGVVGFTGLAVMMFSAFLKNFQKRQLFYTALSGSLLAVIFLGLFDHYFLTLPQGQRLVFMITGLSLANREKVKA